MTKIARVLLPPDSPDAQSFGLALAYAEKIAKAANVNDIILLTHTKSQFEGSTLEALLGRPIIKALSAGKPVALPWGGRLRGETIKTLRFQAGNAVVIASYSNETLLDHVDGLTSVAGVIAVPWVPGEADSWAARWDAHIHGQERTAPAPLIDDPVVVQGLETLTDFINLGSGLGHPSDKKMADEILRILRAKGHADPSANIKSWAIRHNWHPKAAGDLETLARKIWSLKTKPSLAQIHNSDGRYARWKADA